MEDNGMIQPYAAENYAAFKEMIGVCFPQDYGIPLTARQLDGVSQEVVQRADAETLFLDLLFVDGSAKGFIKYQVDTTASDWCERAGWGFIRETYIDAGLRQKGYGRKLARHAESKLQSLAVPHIYLTTFDESKGFWHRLGYRDTGEICEKNNGYIFVK